MTHLHLVAIVVDEYAPAIRFFVDVLGFELVEDLVSTTTDGKPKGAVAVFMDVAGNRWDLLGPAKAASRSGVTAVAT